MMKNIILSIIIVATTSFVSFKYLLAENGHPASGISVTTSKSQELENVSTALKNNRDNNGSWPKTLMSPFKAFGLHIYIRNEGKFSIDTIPKIFNDYKAAFTDISHIVSVELKNLSLENPILKVVMTGIAVWGLLFFIANQFLLRLTTKRSTLLQRKISEIALHRFFVFLHQNYPAIISFFVMYFMICFINVSNPLTKILFWGFGGWLFISCYNTLRNYMLAPHRIRKIYVFHDTTIRYIQNVIKNISLSAIIYFITVNILNIINIPSAGRFLCSLVFITSLFIVTILYFHYGFKKAICHPYTIRYLGKVISEETRNSRLFQIAADFIYFSFLLFFCSEFVSILTGYVPYTLKAIVWFGIVNTCFLSLLLIKIFVSRRLLRRSDVKVVVSSRTITPQSIAVTTFLNPARIVFHLWQYRDLIKQLTWREVIGRYKGSYLGICWSFLQPLLMLTIYTFVFSTILNARWGLGPTEGKWTFALTMFAGLITYGVFSEVLSSAPGLVTANPNYVKKVVFPLEILPIVRLLSALIHAGFSLVILLIGILLVNRSLNYTVIFLPIAWLPMALFSLGLGYFLASLGVFIRDIGHTIGLVLTCLMFLSAIFYPLSALPGNIQKFSCFNPIAVFVEDARRVTMFGQSPIWLWTGIMTAAGGVTLIMGFLWFMKTKKAFADVI